MRNLISVSPVTAALVLAVQLIRLEIDDFHADAEVGEEEEEHERAQYAEHRYGQKDGGAEDDKIEHDGDGEGEHQPPAALEHQPIGIDESIERTIKNLTESEKIYRYAIGQLQEKVCHTKGDTFYIDIALLQTSPSPEALLFEILAPYGFNASQITDILTCCDTPQPGKIFIGTNRRLICDRKTLIVSLLTENTTGQPVATWDKGETRNAVGINISYHPAEGFVIPRSPLYACFDADRLQYPLTLRHWRKGDTFTPFGMRGRKKISDFFSDSKMSIIEKEEQLLLCDATEILWVVGRRAASTASITPHTRHILLVSVANDEVHK